MSREEEIVAALSGMAPDVKVEATPEPDGSQIVVEADGMTYRFSVGKGRSALVNFLLTGYVD